MAEDATRKLLKLFGMAVTDFEDQTNIALEGLKEVGSSAHSPAATLELVGQWLKTNGEVLVRWLEVTQWLMETQAKAQTEFLRRIAEIRQARR